MLVVGKEIKLRLGAVRVMDRVRRGPCHEFCKVKLLHDGVVHDGGKEGEGEGENERVSVKSVFVYNGPYHAGEGIRMPMADKSLMGLLIDFQFGSACLNLDSQAQLKFYYYF